VNLAEKWCLILGREADQDKLITISDKADSIHQSLDVLYGKKARGSLNSSNPNISKWLGDLRRLYPVEVVSVLQNDAVEILGIEKFLRHPEILEQVIPDIRMAAMLLSLKNHIPDDLKFQLSILVEKLVETLKNKLEPDIVVSARLGIQKLNRQNQKRNQHVDWNRTILSNLKNYNHELKQIIPERIYGFNSKKKVVRDIILLIDQSGSMTESMIYSAIIASVLHKISSLSTKLILFDIHTVDMTGMLDQPSELLLGVQMGGGTDIGQALSFVKKEVRDPKSTILFLISDLYDYDDSMAYISLLNEMKQEGITIVVLPGLDDSGTADYDKKAAAIISALGIHCLVLTPQSFCDILPQAINKVK